jgi:hypothetical protein
VRTIAIGAWIGVTALLATACGTSAQHTSGQSTTASTTGTGQAKAGTVVTPAGQNLPKLSTPGTPQGEQTVRIEVLATSTKPTRQTLALVPVYIDGQGPFPFALDTGASRSLISGYLAQRLQLPDRGPAGLLQGVTGASTAENFALASWRAGDVRLPAATIAALGSPSGGGAPPPSATGAMRGPMGLLGSDVLSRYGKIAIDYDKGLLVLDPPVK